MILASLLWATGCVVEPCSFHDECGGGELCWEGVCEQVYDRTWNVEVVSAEVGAVHPDGYEWDPLGGPPDLYAEFGLMPDVCVTSVAAQTFNPIWFESCDFYVPPHGTFGVDLWDVDSTVDELGASYTWRGEHGFAELARTAGEDAGWEDESGTVLLWLRLWPTWMETTTTW